MWLTCLVSHDHYPTHLSSASAREGLDSNVIVIVRLQSWQCKVCAETGILWWRLARVFCRTAKHLKKKLNRENQWTTSWTIEQGKPVNNKLNNWTGKTGEQQAEQLNRENQWTTSWTIEQGKPLNNNLNKILYQYFWSQVQKQFIAVQYQHIPSIQYPIYWQTSGKLSTLTCTTDVVLMNQCKSISCPLHRCLLPLQVETINYLLHNRENCPSHVEDQRRQMALW